MKVISQKTELTAALLPFRNRQASVGFVPTMGALHAGHIDLVKRAVKENEVAVVSIFVNPTQFNNATDLERYPRTPEADRNMLENAGAHFLFSPEAEEMYPGSMDLPHLDLGELETVMEGKFRPGHFQGVAHIVWRLLDAVRPTRAYFGEKDFQQLAIIRHLVRMQKLPVQIIGCPTVRESSGLAMSSRNMRLSDAQRNEAAVISKALYWLKNSGKKYSLADAIRKASDSIENATGLKVEYLEVANENTLRPATEWGPDLRAFAAVFAGDVRLIDNVAL